jgi:hypothetical protein
MDLHTVGGRTRRRRRRRRGEHHPPFGALAGSLAHTAASPTPPTDTYTQSPRQCVYYTSSFSIDEKAKSTSNPTGRERKRELIKKHCYIV